MVEEDSSSNKAKQSTPKVSCYSRPKPAYLWTVNEVQKWFKRHCGEYTQYSDIFLKHEITGKALLRITDDTLLRMGIGDDKHRETIWREIIKQKLKTDIVDFRDLERP